jgi:poly [ADP-ribose] polymerase
METKMSAIIKEERYIFVDQSEQKGDDGSIKKNNNNKSWNIELYDDNTVITRWGRVGDALQSKTFPGSGLSSFESKCREKERKGYEKQHTLQTGVTKTSTVQKGNLGQTAKSQIVTNSPEVQKLIDYLVNQNVHAITENTTLSYNVNSGLFSTPLGIVDANGISIARNLLNEIADFVLIRGWDDRKMADNINQYLRIVPQIIPRTGIRASELFPDMNSVQKQNQILDSLDASLLTALTPTANEDVAPEPKKVFDAKLHIVEDGGIYDKINKYYQAGKQSMHVSSSLKIDKIYAVEIKDMKEAFETNGRKIGGIQELWHGSRVCNLLSILKGGLIIPPASSKHCTGRMFGDGVYFASSSTKSLNYSYGYWSGTSNPHCFMFLADVALGNYYVPKGSYEQLPKVDYDSVWAKKGQSGVMNDEIIVYKTSQCNLNYLVEFKG